MQYPHLASTKYRLVEFYCGIGGMRCALEAAGIPFEVVAAVDVSPVANMIYRHNFGKCQNIQRSIESFTTEEVETMEADIITMSPPCQPFTRLGLKKDTEDSRSISFLHLLNILIELKRKPQYVILENVKGFEISEARNILVQTLHDCGYIFQEFLLTPLNCGIPNSRLRYYMIAKSKSLNFSFPLLKEVRTSFPITSKKYFWKTVCSECQKSLNLSPSDVCPLSHFLEKETSEHSVISYVPDKVLLKYWSVLDIVTEINCLSCCFTKAYGRYASGTGSVLSCLNGTELSATFEKVSVTSDEIEKLNLLKSLKLRYFTPKEIANIMCFPEHFGFPEHMISKQLYRSLGNSINVFVVACLVDLLFQK